MSHYASDDIVISNPPKLERIVTRMRADGLKKLHILADFDRTLTYACVDGKKRPSLISILRDGNYLSPDYALKAHALYSKYSAIEKDPNIPLAEKKKAMEEWWRTHFELLIASGLTKADVVQAVASGRVQFRQGAHEFLNFLARHDIPLVILTSTGLGKDAVEWFFKHEHCLTDNINIISNQIDWDEHGRAVGFREPIVHSLNKDETTIKNFPGVYEKIKDRTNVLLLGDSPSDLGMACGFRYDNLLTVGFLNEDVDKRLEEYKNLFDVVIAHDSGIEYIVYLLSIFTDH